MSRYQGFILALAGTAATLLSSSGAFGQPVTGYSPVPTVEDVSTDLVRMVNRLDLTHEQHEQLDRIIANETMQFWLTRANPNLSVAKIFIQEHAIRLQARREIAAILTPRQKQKLAQRMIHEMQELERWSEDPNPFFSIPAIY